MPAETMVLFNSMYTTSHETRVLHSHIKYYFGEGEERRSKIMGFERKSFSKNPIIFNPMRKQNVTLKV